MCGTLVWKVFGSTFSRPRSSASMPQVSSPRSAGRADAPGGVEQHLGAHPSAVGEEAHGIALLVELDPLDLRAEPELDAALPQLVHEFVDDLAVDELEEVLARLDDRHRHVERREDRRVFDADDAGADHRQAARHMRFGGDVVAVEDVRGR